MKYPLLSRRNLMQHFLKKGGIVVKLYLMVWLLRSGHNICYEREEDGGVGELYIHTHKIQTNQQQNKQPKQKQTPVSYTHLTLPTKVNV